MHQYSELKTSLKSFRELFEKSIAVVHLAESLAALETETDADQARAYAEGQGFDILGVSRQGKIVGTVAVAKIGGGKLKDTFRSSRPMSSMANVRCWRFIGG